MTWRQPEDPGIRALAGRFPGWEVWRGASGLLYARRHGTRGEPVTGEDAADLAGQITRVQALSGEIARSKRIGAPRWATADGALRCPDTS